MTGADKHLRRTRSSSQPSRQPTLLLRQSDATGPRERGLSSALMLGRPARGRRSQTSTRPTLLRSQPNTSHSQPAFEYAQNALALSRVSASGAQAQTAENSHR